MVPPGQSVAGPRAIMVLSAYVRSSSAILMIDLVGITRWTLQENPHLLCINNSNPLL